MIKNPTTGRPIKIGSKTYNKLIQNGYVFDNSTHTLQKNTQESSVPLILQKLLTSSFLESDQDIDDFAYCLDLQEEILKEIMTNITDKKDSCKYSVHCPICRTDNIIDESQKKIYGSSNICVICLENNCEIFFPDCGHIVLCHVCFEHVRHRQTYNIESIPNMG